MKLNFIWKEKTGEYQNGEALYLNELCIAKYGWNKFASIDDRYIGHIELPLPSYSSKRVFGSTPEEIKLLIQGIVIAWFEEALKENNNG